jgi:hypothetical protein
MAFSSFNTQFTRLGPPNDNCATVWTYVTTDTQAALGNPGYFNAVSGKLKVGDLVYVTSASSPWLNALFIVRANTRNLTASPPVTGVVTMFVGFTLTTSA